MYLLYVEKCKTENKIPVKEKFYYNVFSKKFNLDFKQQAKGTCHICDGFELKISNEQDEMVKKTLEINKIIHLTKACLLYTSRCV